VDDEPEESGCCVPEISDVGISVAVYKPGLLWWYRFVWNGESIRESTKRTAEQIEAAHKTSLG
jgi:hypothetical protein